MSLERFLGSVIEALNAEGIPEMLTGSLAAAVRGAARSTMDIDLVIDPAPAALQGFNERMERAGYYVSPAAASDALEHRSMFNVIDPESGWKADLIIRKLRPFSAMEFARRQPTELLGVPVAVARVEDLIIAKLEWASLGGSARQLDDVRQLLKMARPTLDLAYMSPWIETLGLSAVWDAVQQ